MGGGKEILLPVKTNLKPKLLKNDTSLFFFFNFYFICISVVPICMFVYHFCDYHGGHGSQMRTSEYLEVGL